MTRHIIESPGWLRTGSRAWQSEFNPSLLATLGFMIFGSSWAVAAIAPGPDAFGYTVAATSNFTFLQITNVLEGSKRELWFDDDTAFSATNIGFTFHFYGANYTNVSFNVNGLMMFGGPSTDPSNVNLTTMSPTNNQPCIAVLWDDWETKYYGNEDAVYYKTTGTPGNRQFIVQWNKVDPIYGPGIDPVTFEVRLFEGSDRILCSYLDTVVSDDAINPPIASRGAGATVGIRDTSGQTNNRNLQWSFNQVGITNGLHLLFYPPNHPPVATNDFAFAAEDTPITINLLANDTDVDGDVLTLLAVTPGTNGVATADLGGTVTYSPSTNFFGSDHFTYTISDGRGSSATGLVSLTIVSINDPPTLDAVNSLTLDEDSGIQTVTLTGISSGATNENDSLAVTAASSNPALISDPTVVYTSPNPTGSLYFNPATNASGSATITVTVNDGQLFNNTLTRSFTVTVNPINDLPYISVIPNQTNDEDTAIGPVAFVVQDLETPPANLMLSASSTNPTLVPTNQIVFGGGNSNRTVTVTPATNQFGTTLITVALRDDAGGTVSDDFIVTVNPINDPPVASDDNSTTPEDTPLTLNPLLNDTDVDGDALTIIGVSATNGTVLILGGTNLYFTPDTNFNGVASIGYTNGDGHGGTAIAVVSVTVTPVNDSPVARADAADTCVEAALILPVSVCLANDWDADAGDILTITNVSTTSSAGGSVTLAAGNLIYTPPTNFTGLDTFNYTLTDGRGGESTGTVAVRVWPPLNIISVARQSGGSMLIRVCGFSGTNYSMEATSDFNTWTNLGPMSESGLGSFQFEDTGTDGVDTRFYRVLLPRVSGLPPKRAPKQEVLLRAIGTIGRD